MVQMRRLYFLLPGTTEKFRGGGLFAELKTLELAQQICKAEVVTYRQREPEHLFLDDLLEGLPKSVLPSSEAEAIFWLGWGFDVPQLVERLGDRPTLYHAHSAGYGFRLPSRIPIVSVSRNTLGYWGQQASNGLLYYLPNEISPEFDLRQPPRDRQPSRDIDVLVQVRKSSNYLTQQLIPALDSRCRVKILDSFVTDLAGLFNRAKVYLYDSADYWAVSGVTEGFGLPPLEAIACGCQLFSSVNHGLSDFIDPGFNAHKISAYSLEYDLERILMAVQTPHHPDPELLRQQLIPYRQAALVERMRVILQQTNHFFDHQKTHPATIPALTPRRIQQLWLQQTWGKLQKRFLR